MANEKENGKDLTDLRQDLHEQSRAFKAHVEKAEKERADYGVASGATEAKLTEIDAKITATELAINERLDAIETRQNRKKRDASFTDEQKDRRVRVKDSYFSYLKAYACSTRDGSKEKLEKAFGEYAEAQGPDGLKLLQVGNNPLGGYVTAPTEFVEDMIVDLQEQNQVRGLFRQRNTDRKSVTIPKQVGFLAAVWTAEAASRAETTGTFFSQVEVPTHEQHAQVNVTREELEDVYFPMEPFIRAQFTEQFARAEGIAFIDGNGVHKPEGFTINADVTGIQSSSSATFTGDDLISLLYNNLDSYTMNGSFIMERATLKHVRQLKDGEGQYLWSPGVGLGLAADARASMLLGRPIVLADQMPSIGASNKPVFYGDWRVGYLVLDRLLMEMIVDPFSGKANGTIEFSARKRVGGLLVQPQAVQYLQCGA